MQTTSETHHGIPVKGIAIICLIILTCVVAILVYEWYSRPPLVFDGSDFEMLAYTSYQWASGDISVTLTVKNTGARTLTIANVWVWGLPVPYTITPTNGSLQGGSSATIVITQSFTSGTQYDFIVETAKGNHFGPYKLTAP